VLFTAIVPQDLNKIKKNIILIPRKEEKNEVLIKEDLEHIILESPLPHIIKYQKNKRERERE